jgi:hypothetical protein
MKNHNTCPAELRETTTNNNKTSSPFGGGVSRRDGEVPRHTDEKSQQKTTIAKGGEGV